MLSMRHSYTMAAVQWQSENELGALYDTTKPRDKRSQTKCGNDFIYFQPLSDLHTSVYEGKTHPYGLFNTIKGFNSITNQAETKSSGIFLVVVLKSDVFVVKLYTVNVKE